jgi:hypothetical protein
MVRFACILLRHAIDESKGAYRQRSSDCAGRSNMDINCCKKGEGFAAAVSSLHLLLLLTCIKNVLMRLRLRMILLLLRYCYCCTFLRDGILGCSDVRLESLPVLWGTGSSALRKGLCWLGVCFCPDLSRSVSQQKPSPEFYRV